MVMWEWGFSVASIRLLVLIMMSYLMGWGCGSENVATPYASLTKAEQARKALDEERFADAVKLYGEAIAKDPENYELYRFQAAAYAGQAGFDVFDVIANTLSGSGGDSGGDSGGGAMTQLGDVVPANPTRDQLNALGAARDVLLSIPAAHRDASNTDVEGAASASFQLTLYQTAYSLMYMNLFTQVEADGQLDQERLESMTDEDVTAILHNLSSVASESDDPAIAEEAQTVLDTIDQQEGGSQREKLIAYMNQEENGG